MRFNNKAIRTENPNDLTDNEVESLHEPGCGCNLGFEQSTLCECVTEAFFSGLEGPDNIPELANVRLTKDCVGVEPEDVTIDAGTVGQVVEVEDQNGTPLYFVQIDGVPFNGHDYVIVGLWPNEVERV